METPQYRAGCFVHKRVKVLNTVCSEPYQVELIGLLQLSRPKVSTRSCGSRYK